MKFTKKIMTMATCVVMAASSMVGMSASALSNSNDIIGTASISEDGDFFNVLHAGTYYANTGTSFITISGTSSADAECLFYKVPYDNGLISGVTSKGNVSPLITNGSSFTFSGNEYTKEVDGELQRPGVSLAVQYTYTSAGNIQIGNITYSR